MRFLMTRTWTLFHPKPWAPLCAAAPRARPAPCSEASAMTQTFIKTWLQLLPLTFVTGAWGLFFLTQDHCCAAWELPALKPNSFLCRTVLHWEDSRDTHENTGGHKNKPYPLWPKAWYYFFLSYYFYRSHHLGNVVIGEPFTVFSTVVNGSAAL